MRRITPCFLLNSVKTFKSLRVSFLDSNRCAALKESDNVVRTFANLVNQSELEGSVKPKKKKVQLLYVNLLDSEDNKSVMTLENAEKLAKRRHMILIKLHDFDHVTERPTYKLLSSTEYVGQEIHSALSDQTEPPEEQNEKKFKTNKDIVVSGKINQHDLQIKINQVNKLLRKGHTVKIIVLSSKEAREDIMKAIESGVKESGTVSSRATKSSVIYMLSPLAPDVQTPKDENQKANKM